MGSWRTAYRGASWAPSPGPCIPLHVYPPIVPMAQPSPQPGNRVQLSNRLLHPPAHLNLEDSESHLPPIHIHPSSRPACASYNNSFVRCPL